MWKHVLATLIVVAQTTAANGQSCISQGDAGNTRCLAGMLYRCSCSQIVGSSLCSWNNSGRGCSSISSGDDAPDLSRSGVSSKRMTCLDTDRRHP